MSYIDALKIQDTIHIVERDENDVRRFQKFPASYVFYTKHPQGNHTSIYGDSLKKFQVSSYKAFSRELKSAQSRPGFLFEHDINPVFRLLEEKYHNASVPKLHVAFFDIEVDFDPERGFSSPEDPYCPVNAVSVYQSWTGKNITLALAPPTLTNDEAATICDEFEDTWLCSSEEELYERFFDAIDEADVLSGWNSTTFDIPYIIRRLERIRSKDYTKRFCHWNQYPKKRTFEMYGKEQITYDLFGRVHLDYLELYRKHTYHEMHSYSLDAVGEYETGERKVPYSGSLDKLYKNDFKTFIEYNRQDVMVLVGIDSKNKFIDLSNNLAHEMTVLLPTTTGSVALIEQAIVKEIHAKGLIAPSKKNKKSEETSVAGAYVATPKKGMHEWIGSVDINSLYPSTIRALNISPETIVGQIDISGTMNKIKTFMEEHPTKSMADAWSPFFGADEYNHLVNKEDKNVNVRLEDGTEMPQHSTEWYDTIFGPESNLCVSANGTLFRTDKQGIIPGLLERWYSERVELKGKAKDYWKLMDAETEADKKTEFKKQLEFYDQRQLIKKILLNSLYGALLNPHCRFFDQRMGQSVTLTGRCITRHMIAKINELVEGVYNHTGVAAIYGDTDSCYFSAYPVFKDEDFEWSVDNVIEMYDTIADVVNQSFPQFMMDAFHVDEEHGKIIEAGREVVAKRGLFIKKKRYALLCNDIEGARQDNNDDGGKLKALGVELKRSDTPAVIQDFLKDILIKALRGEDEEKIRKDIRKFRLDFRQWPGWQKGTPKRVNGLTQKVEMEKTFGRVAMAGHQRASMNWNVLKKSLKDNYSMDIQDGAKVVVCKLKPNNKFTVNGQDITSIAYPVDQEHLPDWFMGLPFDEDAMEELLIDKKLENILGVLRWQLKRPEDDTTFDDLFV